MVILPAVPSVPHSVYPGYTSKLPILSAVFSKEKMHLVQESFHIEKEMEKKDTIEDTVKQKTTSQTEKKSADFHAPGESCFIEHLI